MLHLKKYGTDASRINQVQITNGFICPTEKIVLYPEDNGETLKCFKREVTPSGLHFGKITLPATWRMHGFKDRRQEVGWRKGDGFKSHDV